MTQTQGALFGPVQTSLFGTVTEAAPAAPAVEVGGSYCCSSCCMTCGREMYVDLNQPGRPWVHTDGWTRDERPCQRIKPGDYVRKLVLGGVYHAEAPIRVESIRGPWATLSYTGGDYRWSEHVMHLTIVP